jgi:hypothetical protein
MYEVGQIVSVGLYAGFHHTKLLRRQARITKIDRHMVFLDVFGEYGGIRKMFGTLNELKKMEELYLA